MRMRKVAVVTGSRAEYGHLFWILKGINNESSLKLQLIVTGMHLSTDFGLTVKEIEKDGFPIAKKVKTLLPSDTEEAIAISMGRGTIGLAKAYSRLKPDMIVVLGDRLEMLAAVSAALPFRIPIAHIHGGESTEGLIDEAIRHAITKMSHIHFTSTETYRKRVIQMGESPDNVFCFGAPGLDNVYKLRLLGKEELCEALNLAMDKGIGIVTFHPVTLERNTTSRQVSELLNAISHFTDISWVFTFPNADTQARSIIKKIKAFAGRFPEGAKVFISLGQVRYLSLLKNASIMAGNSSSGLIEAPSFGLPVVNIGDRQKGRIRGKNVIDVKDCRKAPIAAAIHKALSPRFKASLKGMKNPYGSGNSSKKIVEKIKCIKLDERLIKKEFYRIPV